MNNQMHELLNTPQFKTDLFIPSYKNLEGSNWRINHMGLGFDHGYFSDVWVVENMPILSRRSKDDPDKWESWMSICPHELESQEFCCKCAYGNVVIMGLGMGWVAINTAMNETVKKVIVIELDQEVIDLFNDCGAFYSLKPEVLNKIEIIHADAMKWKPEDMKIDFLYADIWRSLVEQSTLDDVHQMQNNIKADKIYFWGQELFFFREFHERDLQENDMTMNFLKSESEKMNLPLLLPEDVDYPELVMQAGKQRLKRRLPLER